MNLRRLELKDAPLMLEWMHDDEVIHFMGKNFGKKTLEDCESFIRSCWTDKYNVHRAIVDDNDVYMGTVSLKNIDRNLNSAEFAIIIRKQAMGKGYSGYAMEEVINFGFENLGLDSIYWYVNKENSRAIRFYDKSGYHEDGFEKKGEKVYKWYTVQREEVLQKQKRGN